MIAYKLLTFHTPAEDVIIEKFVKAYNDNKDNAAPQNSENLAENVGYILGHALKKIANPKIQAPPTATNSDPGENGNQRLETSSV